MKKHILISLAVIFLSVIGCSEPETFIHVIYVTLNINKFNLIEDEKSTLVATVFPENATDKSVEWFSNKPKVVSVDDNGEITAKSVGTAIITVKTKDGGKSATCIVTVDAKFRPVTSITMDKTSVQLKAGETVTLTATANPDNATDKTVTWSTTDATVATVNNGVVTANKVGTATITAKTGEKVATCVITVIPTPVTSISLDKTNLKLIEGESQTLIATIFPNNASNRNVIWTSYNSSIVKVENGKVTAIKAGTASVIVTTEDGGKTATCNIIVETKPNVENPENGNDWGWD